MRLTLSLFISSSPLFSAVLFLFMNAKVEQCAVPVELESLASTYCRQVFIISKRSLCSFLGCDCFAFVLLGPPPHDIDLSYL